MEVLIEVEGGLVSDVTFWPDNNKDVIARSHKNADPKFYVFDHDNAETNLADEIERSKVPIKVTELSKSGGIPASVAQRLEELARYYAEKQSGT